jgi:hypothetical protein
MHNPDYIGVPSPLPEGELESILARRAVVRAKRAAYFREKRARERAKQPLTMKRAIMAREAGVSRLSFWRHVGKYMPQWRGITEDDVRKAFDASVAAGDRKAYMIILAIWDPAARAVRSKGNR